MDRTTQTKQPGRLTRIVLLSLTRREQAELASLAGERGKTVDELVTLAVLSDMEWARWKKLTARFPPDSMDDDVPF